MTTIMEKEIREQPSALDCVYQANAEVIKKIAAEVKARGIRQIMAAARGSSDNACNYFKYICETYVGIPVSFAAPSVLTLYSGKLSLKDVLVLGVSQSGKAEDVIAVMNKAKADGGIAIAVTNNTQSPMACIADYHLYLNVGEEKSVAATKTFTAQLYTLAMLVNELSGGNVMRSALGSLPAALEEVIASKDAIDKASEMYVGATDCYVLARGFTYAACQEVALKIQETTYIKARSYAVSDFHHGPFAVVDEKTRVIILAPSDESSKDSLEMIQKVKATGAQLIVFSDDDKLASLADGFVKVPSVDKSVTSFVYVVAAQLFACHLSVARGVNPDAPRGLKKVTITK